MWGERLRRFLAVGALLLCGVGYPSGGQKAVPACSNCAVWNAPQAPFRIYGNTYYVGPHGLTSLLITSNEGHVLIDGAIPESAEQIAAHIRALGFRVEDVKLILNSHVHFDHAGGIPQLQRWTGARVAASAWSAAVMKSGGVAKDDPQYGSIRGVARVKDVRVLRDGEVLRVGPISLTAHSTPGHTPGGTTWTWQSCEGGRCLNTVYADSVSAVSPDGYKFTQHPRAVADFEKSFAFLDHVPCDLLLTPHPEASGLWEHLEARRRGLTPDPLVDSSACKRLADGAREGLRKRLESEGKPGSVMRR